MNCVKIFGRSLARVTAVIAGAGFGLVAVSSDASAGVFNIPHFQEMGQFSAGLEPEFTLSNGAGIGVNAKVTHGITEFMNAGATIGTGGGPRRFRFGGQVSFDLFPDLPEQPGIGIAARGMYYRLAVDGQLELQAIPYVHKTFLTAQKDEIEPFMAVPLGAAFIDGRYMGTSQIVIGSMFKNNEHVRYVFEFGLQINNSESYISGGVVFYP